MADITNYQNVFRINKKDRAIPANRHRAARRNRQPVSCFSCRTRKLKCDRQSPCESCVKRGDEQSCIYIGGDKDGEASSGQKPGWTEAQSRLQKLEAMVTSLIKGSSSPEATNGGCDNGAVSAPYLPTAETESDDSEERKDTGTGGETFPPPANGLMSLKGRLDSKGSQTLYLGSTYWESILENIHELQDFLDIGAQEEEDNDAPTLILDTALPMSLEEACGSLPPRNIVDQLLLLYFDSRHLEPPFLHKERFLREYESFYNNPSSMSFLWISIFFSILCVSCRIAEANGLDLFDVPDAFARKAFFIRAGQALVTGKYYKARLYSVEAVLLYAHCKYMHGDDVDTDSWMLMGISIRVAMQMGYHRDPRHLANVTPFEGEMRRRIWNMLQMFDLLLSFRAGLPTVIHDGECDTEPPGNYFDEDLHENMQALPPPRPEDEPTPMLFWRVKIIFVKLLRRILRMPFKGKLPAYDEVMAIEKMLQDARKRIPEKIRLKPLTVASNESIHARIHKTNIELASLKCECALHRVFLTHARENPEYAFSRKACVDAALQILRIQRDTMAWKLVQKRINENGALGSNMMLDDFLRAAMLICVDLHENSKNSEAQNSEERLRAAEEYDALSIAYDCWRNFRDISSSARKAAQVLGMMLAKTKRPVTDDAAAEPVTSISRLQVSPAVNGDTNTTSISATMDNTSPILPGPNHNGQSNTEDGLARMLNTTEPLNDMLRDPHTLKWDFIDQFLFERSGVENYVMDWQTWDLSGTQTGTETQSGPEMSTQSNSSYGQQHQNIQDYLG